MLTLTLWLLACATVQPAKDAGSSADADTDTDTDTDADSDTDADADADHDGDGVPDTEDCAPTDPDTYPGAAEICDGVDQDCDLLVDESLANTVRDETDRGDDGTVDSVSEWDYDAAALLIANRTDTSNDGIDDISCTYAYDRTSVSEKLCDTDANGLLDYAFNATYDLDERPVSIVVDIGADGLADESHDYFYESDGSGRIENDISDDGILDSIVAFDTHGNTTTVSQPVDDAMVVVRRTTSTYDTHGNRIEEAQDEGDDGTIDFRQTNVYDADDQLLSFASDYGDDGTIDVAAEYAYDNGGHAIWYAIDVTNDGEPDQVTTWLYDALSRLVEYTIDSPVGGDPETLIRYTYAENGLSWSIDTVIRGAHTTDVVTQVCSG